MTEAVLPVQKYFTLRREDAAAWYIWNILEGRMIQAAFNERYRIEPSLMSHECW